MINGITRTDAVPLKFGILVGVTLNKERSDKVIWRLKQVNTKYPRVNVKT